MPSAALTLPGNAGCDARVNDDSICDPLQGSLTIGEVTPVIFASDLTALAPREAISVVPSCLAEIDQVLVSFINIAAYCVALPVKDGAAVAVYHSGCDPPAVNCF
jgi:hypothetical protein